MQLRGYSRRQVDEFVARCRSQVRELEERLGRSLDDGEQLRQEVKALRQQALGNRPAHEEVSERISQILKLADDEAKAQKTRADDDIKKQLADAQQEADRTKKEARDQAEHMLTAAQEQAERAISTARAEADKTRNAACAEADHTTGDARKKAESVLVSAKSQANQTLDEATARATAIHDGAERLNLLSTRHSETIRRLTEILDGVSRSGHGGDVAPVARGRGGSERRQGHRARSRAAPPPRCRPPRPRRRRQPPRGQAASRGRPASPARTRFTPAGERTRLPGRRTRRPAGGPPGLQMPGSKCAGWPGRGRWREGHRTRPARPVRVPRPRPGAAGPARPHREPAAGDSGPQADGSLTGSIDSDEVTEGVRIVRERQH